MSRLGFHLLAAFLTFVIGVMVVSLWFVNRLSPSPATPAAVKTEIHHEAPVPTKLEAVIENRDLSLYDFAGRQGCGNVPVSEFPRCKASIKTARAFIWQHWQEKKRGYVIVKMASDDAESDAHIFIEPDKSGAWHVVWKWERIFALSIGENISGRIDDGSDIRLIERRRETNYEDEVETFRLLFFDKDGEETQSL